MTFLNQSEYYEPISQKVCQDPNESFRMECGRLIHAAVINRRFMNMLLANPIKSIENGFCGEKFAFTREEKHQINLIHASTLAEFSNQLLQAVEISTRISTASEMSFDRWEIHKGLSA
jgi:hypothetical protein